MTDERVEAIRRWHADHVVRNSGTHWCEDFDCGTVGDLLTALAQAERTINEFKATNRLLMGERDAARAEVERLNVTLARVRGAREAAAQTFRNLRDSGLDQASLKLLCAYAVNLIDAALEDQG